MAIRGSLRSADASAAGAVFHYRVYGCALRANQPVAGLSLGARSTAPDLTLNVLPASGDTGDESVGDVLLENVAAHASGRPILRVSRLIDGGHLLEHGSGVVCRIDRDARSMTVRWPTRLADDPWEFVLGFASAYLLQRRSVVCLHAAAVAVNGEAILIAGPPEAGKSTLAAALLTRGHRLLTDDVAALADQGGDILVQPGPATLRPRASALMVLHALRGGTTWWSPSAETGCIEIDPMAIGAYATDAARVSAVCILSPDDDVHGVRLETLDATAAAVALIGDMWGTRLGDSRMRALELDQVTRTVAQANTFRLTYNPAERQWPLEALARLVESEPRVLHAG